MTENKYTVNKGSRMRGWEVAQYDVLVKAN